MVTVVFRQLQQHRMLPSLEEQSLARSPSPMEVLLETLRNAWVHC